MPPAAGLLPLDELNWKYFGSIREPAGGMLDELKSNRLGCPHDTRTPSTSYVDSGVSLVSPLLAEWCRTGAELELFNAPGICVLLIRC